MGNIGNLNFRIGGDDKELREIFAARKKDALEIEKIFSSMKLGSSNPNKQIAEKTKLLEQQNRLIISNANAEAAQAKSAATSLIAEQRVNDAIEKGKQAKLQTLRVDHDRLAAAQRQRNAEAQLENIRKQQLISGARLASIERERFAKELLLQQRLRTEIQRTEAAKKRAALVGTTGQQSYNQALGLTNRTMFSQRALLMQLSNALGIYFSIYQAGAFVKELAKVSGEFEKQRLSLSAILQDKEAADKIFGQIKDLAVYSPFNFKELTDYAKQLSAFSIPANELFDTMKRLADISAGLGVDMNRIVLAYGQVRSASVLRGQELRQFTEAGIPLIDELAKKFTKLNGEVTTAGDVFDKISNREVPFAMIKEIFEDMTNEGGKFFEMQKIQATSLAGMISNLRDAYDIMLDSIGEANRGMLKGAVGGLIEVMDHWEKYWKILQTIIVAYGSYKAAVIASTVAQKGLIQSIRTLAISQSILASISKINPYALAFAGITALIGGLVAFANSQEEAKDKMLASLTVINNQAESVNKLMNRLKELTKETNSNKNAEQEREEIISKLLQKEPELAHAIQKHADNLDALTAAQERYNIVMDARKFAVYAVSETGGIFSNSIVENLEDRTKAQNVADMSAVKLDLTYTKLLETMAKTKEVGGVPTNLGVIDFAPGREKEINDILASEKSHAEKVLEVYKLVQVAADERRRGSFKYREGGVADTNLYNQLFTGDHKDNVKEYSQNLWDLSLITKKTDADISALAITLERHFRNKKIDVFDKDNEALLRNYVKNLEQLDAYAQKEILTKWNIEFEVKGEPKSVLDGWRKELDEVLNKEKNVIPIQVETNMNDLIDEMKKKYKELKTRTDEQKPILIKLGYDFSADKFPAPLAVSSVMDNMIKNYKSDLEQIEKISAGGKLFGFDLKDLYSPKDKGQPKDKFTEELKRQVELIKDAKKQYEALRKTMSPTNAFSKLSSIDEYKQVKQSTLSDEGYVNYLRAQLKKIEGKNTDTVKNVRVAWNKELGAIQIEKISKDALLEVSRIEKYLSKHKQQYKLYEQIFGITGDKGQAADMAFGSASASVTSYIDAMKQKFQEVSGISFADFVKQDDAEKETHFVQEHIKKLYEEIEQSVQDKDFSLKVDMSNIIAEYATLEEKIQAIRNLYKKLREEVQNSELPKAEIDKAVAGYEKAEEDKVQELQKELLQLTPFYQQLFGDLSEIGYRHLEKLVKKAKSIVDLIAHTKDEKGRLKYGNYKDDKLKEYFLPNEDESVSDTVVKLKEYEQILKKIATIQKDMRKQNVFASLIRPKEEYKNADGSQMDNLDIMASKATDLNTIVQQLAGSFSEMFDALGNESAADTTAFIGDMMSSASDIAQGIASKNPVQVITGIVSGISAIAKNHDKKLDKAIKKSQTEVKKLKNEYSELQRVVERQLGAVHSAQAKRQVENLEKQKRELQSQINNERDKKKTDNNAILDYQNQISELNDQIRYFYEDLAGEQFGIKIKDWAKSISDSLVDAWSKGEDAAKAFDNTVADIMKNVFKNVLQLQYVEKSMNSLRNYLFGSDGRGGILGDGELSPSEMNGLVGELASMKNNIGDWKKAWDYLVQAAKQAGINLEETMSTDTLSKGIQAVTEDTASLLASYINAMRADLSVQRSMVERIMLYAERNSNVFALMQADIVRIQVNTLIIATNTHRLVEISENTNSILSRASMSGSGVRFNVG